MTTTATRTGYVALTYILLVVVDLGISDYLYMTYRFIDFPAPFFNLPLYGLYLLVAVVLWNLVRQRSVARWFTTVVTILFAATYLLSPFTRAVMGRFPTAAFCEYQASTASTATSPPLLSALCGGFIYTDQGDYQEALGLITAVHVFNFLAVLGVVYGLFRLSRTLPQTSGSLRRVPSP